MGRYDVLISGGGIVGAALACRVASAVAPGTRRIACLEVRSPQSFSDATASTTPDIRTYALAPASVRVLKEAGVWERIFASGRHQRFDQMQIWDATGTKDGYVRFSSECDLGYIVENSVVQSALYERMQELEDEGKLELHCPATVETIDREAVGGYHVGTTAKEMYTNLLVAADGGMSKIRQLAGLGSWGRTYEQKAVVATVRLAPEAGERSMTWQRFLPSGPVAILPLWDGMASIVWSTSMEEAKTLQQDCAPEEFLRRLNKAFHGEGNAAAFSLPPLPPLPFMPASGSREAPAFLPPPLATELVSPLASFPLKLEQASTYSRPGLALVGDAAHTIHPMAGQGLNYGLGDVECLTNSLLETDRTGGNFGDHNVLQVYEDERKRANAAIGTSLDVVKRLFESDSSGVQMARVAGMAALNANPAMKEQITKFAMGL